MSVTMSEPPTSLAQELLKRDFVAGIDFFFMTSTLLLNGMMLPSPIWKPKYWTLVTPKLHLLGLRARVNSCNLENTDFKARTCSSHVVDTMRMLSK